MLCIPQSFNITGTTPLDCLVSYPGHSWWWWWGVLPLCRGAVSVFYSSRWLGNRYLEIIPRTRHSWGRGLTLLQRYSQRIVQPQLTGQQVLGDHSKGNNYNWYHYHLSIPNLFQQPVKILVFIYLFVIFLFPFMTHQNSKIHY